MRLSDFQYELPSRLIAQSPAERRTGSRLLVVDRARGAFADSSFERLGDWLAPGDCLVFNDTKVMPARMLGRKAAGGASDGTVGAAVEALLLRPLGEDTWEVMARPGKRLGIGARISFGGGRLRAEVVGVTTSGSRALRFDRSGAALMDAIHEIGQVPLPPYIKRGGAGAGTVGGACACKDKGAVEGTGLDKGAVEGTGLDKGAVEGAGAGVDASAGAGGETSAGVGAVAGVGAGAGVDTVAGLDVGRYQTVYARHLGSAAAPTAGLHFTEEFIEELARAGVGAAYLTLHIGPGTFQPVKAEIIEEHRMHEEFYRVGGAAARAVNDAAGRVVAVGTTSMRTVESVAGEDGRVRACEGWTSIFIYPGFRFRRVGALLTNFHLPGSTLLMLVCAFAGHGLAMSAYRHAVAQEYRFFSFGDAMLIV